jgi:hypothetical protein
MLLRRMQLCDKVCVIPCTPRRPSDHELTLAYSIGDPMETQVHCFGALGLCGLWAIGEAHSTFIVRRDKSGLLRET